MSDLAKDWAKKQVTKSLTLPSGIVITIKSSQLRPMLLANIMPMSLLAKVTKGGELGANETGEVLSFVSEITKLLPAIVVEPRIILHGAADPEQGEISVLDIPDEDLRFLIHYLVRGQEADALATFPDGAVSAVGGPSLSPVPSTSVNGTGPG